MSAVQQRREALIAARNAALEVRRKRGIIAIKAAVRALGLDDGTYRDMLEAQTRTSAGPGKRSATELTLPEQSRVLDHLRKSGAKHPRAAGGRKRTATPAADRAALMAKLHALLVELGNVTGEAHSLKYADAICARNGWATTVDFCGPSDLHKLVGALARTIRAKAKAAGKTTAA